MATAPAVGIYPEANIPYGIAQFNGHDPLLPQSYFVTFRGPVKGVAGAAILLPLIDSAQVARQYGVQWILAGAGAAATSGVVAEPAEAKPVDLNDKRKPRYQANSAEVRNFYRVNSYPVR